MLVIIKCYCEHWFVKHFTLERDFWFASIVTSPAQQTKALELDRPELGGMVPSTTHDIPAKWASPHFSYEENTAGRLIKLGEVSLYYGIEY